MTELFCELNRCGFRLPNDILSEEEGAELLASALK